MGLTIGDVDVGTQIIDNEYKSRLALEIIQVMINKGSKKVTQEDVEQLKEKVVKILQGRYPNMNVKMK